MLITFVSTAAVLYAFSGIFFFALTWSARKADVATSRFAVRFRGARRAREAVLRERGLYHSRA